MSISIAASNAMDTSQWSAHCWVTVKEQHEAALNTLLNAISECGQFLAIPVGEIVLSGLSDDQISALISACPDTVYRDDFDSIYVLEDLWHAAEDAVASIAPDATQQRLIAVNLSFSDPQMVEKMRAELSGHPLLNYAEIEFGED